MIIFDVQTSFLQIATKDETQIIYEFEIKYFLKKHFLIFCDLEKYGMVLMGLFTRINIKPNLIRIFRGEIYQLVVGQCVIKCYRKFGYKDDKVSTINLVNYLMNLDEFF